MEKFNLEKQYELYLERVNLKESNMGEVQKREMSETLKQNETAKLGIAAVMHRYFNQLMRFLFNKQIRNAYYRKGWHWYNLPFYMNIGKYKLCIYAMDMDWDSMRIKIEKDYKIVKVIKRGIF